MTAIAGDKAVVTVLVAAEPAVAFAVFTEEIDLWWRHGPAYRLGGQRPGVMTFEPRTGGRLFEAYDTDDGPRAREIGVVLAWEPPSRLVFEWRNENFAPSERTEVEVRFEPATRNRTKVTVEHRGWAALPPDHPARHGQEAAVFAAGLGTWWGELMTAMRRYVSERVSGASSSRT